MRLSLSLAPRRGQKAIWWGVFPTRADAREAAGLGEGRVFGLEGRGRPVQARFLHIFDFTDGLISRESAWIDLAAIQQQLPD